MDPKIINDTFEQTQKICSFCNCPQGTHLIWFRCPLFENNFICQEDCQISMMKDDIDIQVSAKLGKPVTKDFINLTCKNCGMNNACQNNELAKKLETGTLGEKPDGPFKSR